MANFSEASKSYRDHLHHVNCPKDLTRNWRWTPWLYGHRSLAHLLQIRFWSRNWRGLSSECRHRFRVGPSIFFDNVS